MIPISSAQLLHLGPLQSIGWICLLILSMIKNHDLIAMRAIAICFKPFLKPEEALIYCNLGRTQFAKKCEEYSVYKNDSGYFKKEDLDTMLSGAPSHLTQAATKLRF
jgi:hypothetical protein